MLSLSDAMPGTVFPGPNQGKAPMKKPSPDWGEGSLRRALWQLLRVVLGRAKRRRRQRRVAGGLGLVTGSHGLLGAAAFLDLELRGALRLARVGGRPVGLRCGRC